MTLVAIMGCGVLLAIAGAQMGEDVASLLVMTLGWLLKLLTVKQTTRER
jgi:hypothetical protein